jgi:hypothetical protein
MEFPLVEILSRLGVQGIRFLLFSKGRNGFSKTERAVLYNERAALPSRNVASSPALKKYGNCIGSLSLIRHTLSIGKKIHFLGKKAHFLGEIPFPLQVLPLLFFSDSVRGRIMLLKIFCLDQAPACTDFLRYSRWQMQPIDLQVIVAYPEPFVTACNL